MTIFTLPDAEINSFKNAEPAWGYRDIYGTPVGEVVFLRTYSRKKDDGTKESWFDVCRRVIEGMFTIQKRHCVDNLLPWDEGKAVATALDAFERMFNFKWLPPGRGLWMMGTPLVMEQRNSAALQNCAFVSTYLEEGERISTPFAFLMEASMLGIGVGFDYQGMHNEIRVSRPLEENPYHMVIEDSREGWVESVRRLIDSYTVKGARSVEFDYSLIRPAGSPIKTFGGTAAGHEPLKRLHESIREVLDKRHRAILTGRDIADIGNLIGVCVVSGNVRRSAELLLGDVYDKEFLHLKNYDRNPDRAGHGWMSNNSVRVNRYDDLSAIEEGIALNGEPGVVWIDTSREYGRLADAPNYKDMKVAGYNPCAEQSLESYECCTLVETFIDRHDGLEDYLQTLKVAYLYAKTVTLLPTHWPRTNAVMQRNRRIGTSVSGVTNFLDNGDMTTLRHWLNNGYAEVKRLDDVYSSWLGVRESVKTTTVKPSGTVSLLAGSSPGAHWPVGGTYHLRRVTFSSDDPMVQSFRDAGYTVEDSVYTPGSVVVEFPILSRARRSEKDVSVWEKAMLAGELQRWWSDNSVSVTVSFDKETERSQIGPILRWGSGNLKTVSFLPMGNETYPQMPYENLDDEQWCDRINRNVFHVDMSIAYGGAAKDAIGEAFCTTDACEMPSTDDTEKAEPINMLGIEIGSNDE